MSIRTNPRTVFTVLDETATAHPDRAALHQPLAVLSS